MKVWRMLGHYNAETTTYSACSGAAQTSPYTPDFDGRLVGLRTLMNRDAATTLQNHVQFRLSCNTFNPNVIHCGNQGSGLQTAPALGAGGAQDWQVDQPVKAGVPITVEARNVTEDTPITVSTLIYGLFITR